LLSRLSNELQALEATVRPFLNAVLVSFALCGFATVASAQDFDTGSAQVPYGFGYGQEEQEFDPRTRDANNNRLIVNGRMGLEGSTLSLGLMFNDESTLSGFDGNQLAVGNQLNVTVQGSWNTVIIDSTQINNGNQTVR
jgi:holdfast attachment protein HfaA